MRLLTEYMSVPEVNKAVISSNLVIKKENNPVGVELESVETRNLNLAKKVEAYKSELIKTLSKFPVTALWVLNKYEQNAITDEQEDDNNAPSEYTDLLKEIKKYYQEASLLAGLSDNHSDNFSRQADQLRLVVQQFPFAFDDLIKLVDIVSYAYKYRGLTFNLGTCQGKRRGEIILNRLHGMERRGKPSLAEQFKAMDLDKNEGQFLFLSVSDMSQIFPEMVLSEYDWLNCRQQLATANAKLVLFIANQYKGNFLDFEDLVQEGHTGLLKAVDRFKYRLGFQFSTYAGYWIRQAISRALSRSERVVRIPCGQIATINKLFRAKDELTLKNGKEPSTKELAQFTQLSQEDINNILSISQTSVALEGFDDDDDDQAFAPIDFLEQKVFSQSFSMIAECQLHKIIHSAVRSLNSREAKIICSHFGVDCDHQKTLQEIGEELNLTRERVRQIQVVALNKIKIRYGEQLLSYL